MVVIGLFHESATSDPDPQFDACPTQIQDPKSKIQNPKWCSSGNFMNRPTAVQIHNLMPCPTEIYDPKSKIQNLNSKIKNQKSKI